jgi:hypothetical protein
VTAVELGGSASQVAAMGRRVSRIKHEDQGACSNSRLASSGKTTVLQLQPHRTILRGYCYMEGYMSWCEIVVTTVAARLVALRC